MIQVLKKAALVTLLALFTCSSIANGATENGITRTDTREGQYYIYSEYVFFNDYDFGTATMVYNGAGSSTATAGSVVARRYMTSKVIQIQVPTLGSTGVNINIYGQAGTDTNWGLIEGYATSSATTQSKLIEISENVDNIRIGGQATGTDSTDLVTVTGTFIGRQ